MSNLIPIKICELAIENLNKRIAELEAENNRLRAETTRTIIPEEAYNELKEKYDAILRDKIPPTSEYQKLVDRNIDLRIDAEYWKEEYRKLLGEYNKLK